MLAKAQNEMEKKAEARKKEASLRAQPEPKRKSRFDQGQLASSSSSLPSGVVTILAQFSQVVPVVWVLFFVPSIFVPMGAPGLQCLDQWKQVCFLLN